MNSEVQTLANRNIFMKTGLSAESNPLYKLTLLVSYVTNLQKKSQSGRLKYE